MEEQNNTKTTVSAKWKTWLTLRIVRGGTFVQAHWALFSPCTIFNNVS